MNKRKALILSFLSLAAMTISACSLLPQNMARRKSSENNEISESIPEEYSSIEKPSSIHYSSEQPRSSEQYSSRAPSSSSIRSSQSPINSSRTPVSGNESPIYSSSSSYSEESSSSSNPYSDHTHTFGEWYMVVEPTCTENGEQVRQCSVCGEVEYRTVLALGHDFSIYLGTTATCTNVGYATYECSRCHKTTYIEDKADHTWASTTEIAPYDSESVGYTISDCSNCNHKKIEIKALDGTFDTSSRNKSGTPEGFMKLNANNNSISWKFYLDAGYQTYYGMIYQRAMMDSFSNNQQRTYAWYSSSSSSLDYEEGNFRLEVNGSRVDKSDYMYLTYGEMLSGGEDTSYVNQGYSPIALCPIGQVTLYNGLNEITYRRLGSYNLMISDLVLVIYPDNHTHDVSSYWTFNNVYHWHECTNPNCSITFDQAEHTYGEPYDIVEPTCVTEGTYKQQCVVCGYVNQVFVDTVEHDWQRGAIVQPTKEAPGYVYSHCSNCGEQRSETIYYGQTIETALTVDEAVEIGLTLPSRSQTEQAYYVKGIVSEIVIAYSDAYRNITFWLSSSTKAQGFECYRVSLEEGMDPNSIVIGAEVCAYGHIYQYTEQAIEFNGSNNKVISVNYEPQPVTGINLGAEILNMAVGSTRQLELNILPYNDNSTIAWMVSNSSVISFDSSTRNITAIKDGTAVITAYSDKNENGALDSDEISASVTIEVFNTDYYYDSTNLLGYNGSTINYTDSFATTINGINFTFPSGVSANYNNNGCLRLNKAGSEMQVNGFPYPIAKIIITPYENKNFAFNLAVGYETGCLYNNDAISMNNNGTYEFTLDEDIRAFTIQNPTSAILYIQSIAVVLYEEQSEAVPNGTYTGYLATSDGSQSYFSLAFANGTAAIRIVSGETIYANYSYDDVYHSLSMYINEDYGYFTAIYIPSWHKITSGHLTGNVANYLTNNDEITLNEHAIIWDCDGTTEELQNVFKRRYRQDGSQWVVDTNNADCLTSSTEHVAGNGAVSVRPYINGAIALNLLNDLETPIECSSIGFWVYNPGENDISLRMWIYKGTGHTNAMEIGSVTARAGQWTYCTMGFTRASIYNIQIADFTNSGVRLSFDNICLSY